MFDLLNPIPADPILNLGVECKADTNPNKVDLGAGVYKDESGNTPIMQAVLAAQAQWHEQEPTKTYVGPAGLEGFNQSMARLVLGSEHSVIKQGRYASVQTPGGCGALSLAGHLIARCQNASGAEVTVWVSTPTWANHIPLLAGCGLSIKEYPYYNHATHTLDFEAMKEGLSQVKAGDVVLLHGCCHNPSGADLNLEQWQVVTALLNEKGAVPFVDIAYQGLGDGLDEDAQGLRYMAEHSPEMIVAASCSKNFGLYRERVGSVMAITNNVAAAEVSRGQILNAARAIYSMPPNHGAALVDLILNNDALRTQWQSELQEMRERIFELRSQFVAKLQAAGAGSRFDYIQNEKGMFSFLGISPEQVAQLKAEKSIYMVNSSRINVAGLSNKNMDYLVASLMSVV